MEDEVRKHIEKIYKGAARSRHSFAERLKEIVIEIFIIMFAVTVSIWLHNWSEHRHERKVAAEFLKGLRSDLKEDVKQIERNKSSATNLLQMYDILYHLSAQTIYHGEDS